LYQQVVLEVTDVEGRVAAVEALLAQRGFRVVVDRGGLGGNVMLYASKAGSEEVPAA
jgi:hypothetical protein